MQAKLHTILCALGWHSWRTLFYELPQAYVRRCRWCDVGEGE